VTFLGLRHGGAVVILALLKFEAVGICRCGGIRIEQLI
jgi:hypothetical protein